MATLPDGRQSFYSMAPIHRRRLRGPPSVLLESRGQRRREMARVPYAAFITLSGKAYARSQSGDLSPEGSFTVSPMIPKAAYKSVVEWVDQACKAEVVPPITLRATVDPVEVYRALGNLGISQTDVQWSQAVQTLIMSNRWQDVYIAWHSAFAHSLGDMVTYLGFHTPMPKVIKCFERAWGWQQQPLHQHLASNLMHTIYSGWSSMDDIELLWSVLSPLADTIVGEIGWHGRASDALAKAIDNTAYHLMASYRSTGDLQDSAQARTRILALQHPGLRDRMLKAATSQALSGLA